ncbi:MAG: class I SAM-dependent methyltransferase [Pyrinomonadaceae bacterium]
MIPYRLSPYISFIDNRLFPGVVQHGVFHRFTGEVLEPGETVRALLLDLQTGNRISLGEEILNSLDADAVQLRQLIEKEVLIPDGYDPLTPFADQQVARPIQNPALTHKSEDGEVWLVQTSMAQHVFSPRAGELPEIIEEKISPLAANVFTLADGSRTLQEVFTLLGRAGRITDDSEFRESLEFLTSLERQLIKFTSRADDLDDPYSPVNIVPRDLYHSSKWQGESSNGSSESIIDFHQSGIEDAWWEFDLIEPTVNHSFRFPSESLGGLDYGSRFCVSTLRPEIVPALLLSDRLEVLEVGGGTGTFARSFIQQAATLNATALKGRQLNYHILDLSPTLIQNQRQLLSQLLPPSRHFEQDATKFDIPGQKFDLIVSNEVVADFPMASVERRSTGEPGDNGQKWQGDGTDYLEKYNLPTAGAPDSFLLNAGTFQFIERCWEHLSPGGTLILSEYGAAHIFPVQSFHLNHEEFSIHFGHLAACGAKVGFKCRLLTLAEFLTLDPSVPALNGREEHILCLNHIFRKHGMSLPYAVVSKSEFKKQFQGIIEQIELTGFSFSPVGWGYHFGPRIDQFMVLILNKPI